MCDEFSLGNFIFYNEGSVIVCLFLFHHAKVWLIATKPRRAILRIYSLFLLLCGAKDSHDNASMILVSKTKVHHELVSTFFSL